MIMLVVILFICSSVNSIKYFGVTIDKYLKWDTYIGIAIKKKLAIFSTNSEF
jgi:hypothetical protein